MATTKSPTVQDDDDLQMLSDLLVSLPKTGSVEQRDLSAVLEASKDDLKKLLDNPTKNDTSRNKLREGP
jgi:hypothetical protein